MQTNVINKAEIGGLSKFFTIGVLLLPILNQYVLPIGSFLDLFMLISLTWHLIGSRKLPIRNKALLLYFLYALLVTIIMCSTYSGITASSLVLKIGRLILIILVIYLLGSQYFDFEYAYSIYTKIVYIIIASVLIQYIMYVVAGAQTALIIPNTTLNYMSKLSSNVLIRNKLTARYYRPSSYFIEAAHQAEYVIPWIGMSLFKEDDNKSIKKAVLTLAITVVLCIGASFTALACCSLIWIVYIFHMFKKTNRSPKYFIFAIVLVIAIIGIASYLLTIPSIQHQIERKVSSYNDIDSTSSFTLRLLRGFYCFSDIDIIHKIFGCGYNGYAYYYNHYGIVSRYVVDESHVSYMSGFFSALCDLGIVGIVIYFSFLLPAALRRTDECSKILLFVLALLMICSDIFETPVYFIMVLLIISNKNYIENKAFRGAI